MKTQFKDCALVLASFVVVTRTRRVGADPENDNETNGSVGLSHQSVAIISAMTAENRSSESQRNTLLKEHKQSVSQKET